MHHILWNILGYVKTGQSTKDASPVDTIDFLNNVEFLLVIYLGPLFHQCFSCDSLSLMIVFFVKLVKG